MFPHDPHRRPRGAGARTFLLAALFLSLATLGGGCAATVGDGCASNRECATGQECDTAPPGGYCLIATCRSNQCPSEAWCASFGVADRTRTFCLRKCQADGDCRSGYKCRLDLNTPGGVCYIAPTS